MTYALDLSTTPIERGCSWGVYLEFKTPVSMAPTDLSDLKAVFTLFSQREPDKLSKWERRNVEQIAFTQGLDEQIVSDTPGAINIRLYGDDTRNIPLSIDSYHLALIEQNGERWPMLTGKVRVIGKRT